MYKDLNDFVEERIRFTKTIVDWYEQNRESIPLHQKEESQNNYFDAKESFVYLEIYKQYKVNQEYNFIVSLSFIKIRWLISQMAKQINDSKIYYKHKNINANEQIQQIKNLDEIFNELNIEIKKNNDKN